MSLISGGHWSHRKEPLLATGCTAFFPVVYKVLLQKHVPKVKTFRGLSTVCAYLSLLVQISICEINFCQPGYLPKVNSSLSCCSCAFTSASLTRKENPLAGMHLTELPAST